MTLSASLCALVLGATAGGGSTRIAVLEFDMTLKGSEARNVDRTYFSDQVRGAISQSMPTAIVMTRENTVQLLGSFGKKVEDCLGECEVETGKLLGAEYVVSGRLTRIGTRFKLTLRMHRTGDAALVSTAVASGESINALDDATPRAIEVLLRPMISFAPDRGSIDPNTVELHQPGDQTPATSEPHLVAEPVIPLNPAAKSGSIAVFEFECLTCEETEAAARWAGDIVTSVETFVPGLKVVRPGVVARGAEAAREKAARLGVKLALYTSAMEMRWSGAADYRLTVTLVRTDDTTIASAEIRGRSVEEIGLVVGEKIRQLLK